jgi:glyoxylase-like metal-dependent hydrolase (beta-lactamase superfamily II)
LSQLKWLGRHTKSGQVNRPPFFSNADTGKLSIKKLLRYHTIPVTASQQNCSIVWCDETLQATVIDPGHGPQSTFGHERHGNPYVGGT